jgi:ribonuclease P protein subunit RPR2
MAKKQHRTAPPNPHSIPNRDIMQRLNFLYQASTYLTSLSATKSSASSITEPGPQPVTPSDPAEEGEQTDGGEQADEEEQTDEEEQADERGQVDEGHLATPAYLSRAYVSSMKAIGQKTVVKL